MSTLAQHDAVREEESIPLGQKGLTTDIYTRLKGMDADLAETFFKNFVLP